MKDLASSWANTSWQYLVSTSVMCSLLLVAAVLATIAQALQLTDGDGVLPVDLLLGDQEPNLSEEGEVMDAASLLHLIEKLKEEQADGKVRGSFERLAATLHALSRGADRRAGSAVDTLAMLSEEEESTEDTGVIYPGDYYSDIYQDGGDSDPSLLQLQAWTKRLDTDSTSS